MNHAISTFKNFNLATAIAKPVLRYARYRDTFYFFTINIVDEILSVPLPYNIACVYVFIRRQSAIATACKTCIMSTVPV